MSVNILSRVWESNVLVRQGVTCGSVAQVCGVQVGNKHAWKFVHDTDIVFTTSDVDGNAVHVHFSVANSVKPGPGESRLAVCNTFWNRKVKLVDAVKPVCACVVAEVRARVSATWTGVPSVQVQGRICGTSLLDTVDDSPIRWIFDRDWVCLIGQTELTRSTSVHSCVVTATSVEGQELL